MKYTEATRDLLYKRNTKYILVGQECFLKERFIQEAKKVFSEYSICNYYPEDIEEIIIKLSSESLFQSQLIIIRKFNKIKNAELLSLVEQTNHAIILVTTDDADVRSKGISQAISKLVSVECLPFSPYGNDYLLWITNRATLSGYTLETGVDEHIYSMVGPNFNLLDNELKKIFLYKTLDKHITKKDAEEVVSSLTTKNNYDMLDSVLRLNIINILSYFYSYSKNNSNYVGLVLFLQHYFEKMVRLALLLEQKVSEDSIASILSIPKFILKTKYIPRIREIGKNKVEKIFDSLCNIDIQLRIFKGDKKILMENYILSLKGM